MLSYIYYYHSIWWNCVWTSQPCTLLLFILPPPPSRSLSLSFPTSHIANNSIQFTAVLPHINLATYIGAKWNSHSVPKVLPLKLPPRISLSCPEQRCFATKRWLASCNIICFWLWVYIYISILISPINNWITQFRIQCDRKADIIVRYSYYYYYYILLHYIGIGRADRNPATDHNDSTNEQNSFERRRQFQFRNAFIMLKNFAHSSCHPFQRAEF